MTGQQTRQDDAVARITVNQAAVELGIDRAGVLRLIKKGDLRAINVAPSDAIRKTWRIDEDDLRRFMAARGNIPPEEGA